MHPVHHAHTSARLFGGDEALYLELHRFIDRSKRVVADFRHRALTHHVEGVADAVLRFGPRTGEGLTHLVAEAHIREDCAGRLPRLRDWLMALEIPAQRRVGGGGAREGTNRQSRAPGDTLEGAAEIFGGPPETYATVHRWLAADSTPTAKELVMRHHSEGIFACEEALGVQCTDATPVRYVAECFIRTRTGGAIPTQADWLRQIRRERWMASHCPVSGDEGWLRRGRG